MKDVWGYGTFYYVIIVALAFMPTYIIMFFLQLVMFPNFCCIADVVAIKSGSCDTVALG